MQRERLACLILNKCARKKIKRNLIFLMHALTTTYVLVDALYLYMLRSQKHIVSPCVSSCLCVCEVNKGEFLNHKQIHANVKYYD